MNHDLLQNVFIYLASSVVMIPLFARFGLGSVLGYLAAGCLIGPFGFGFVKDYEEIMHLSEFGVVLMLFVIGLELDATRLWNMRKTVFGGGLLQMLTCSVALFFALRMAGLNWQSALVAGCALALSSTAIVMQSMAERNIAQSPLGKGTFGVLLFQDIAAIPLMALVPLLSSEEVASSSEPMWVSGAKIFAAIAFVIVAGRYLTRPLLRVVAGVHSRDVFTSFALLVVVGISLLMNAVGVSMALGAFLAGVLLASSEYRHALEADIEPFKGLLLGLFFTAVGMSINFALLMREPLFIASMVAVLILTKTVILSLIAPRLSVAPQQKWLLGLLLSQGGEFAFVVFGVAREARLLPGNWDARLTLAVALSMALTPILLLAYDKWTCRNQAQKEDEVFEAQDAPIIIAGFGRFGQIVGRMLMASGLPATIIDHDPEQIEFLAKFGFRVFYGDATRIDLLEVAGANKAKLLVVAIDGQEDSLQLIDRVKEHFPHLKIAARARNVTHYFELRERGIELIQRETFESAIRLGRESLEVLGVRPHEARERADRFRIHNIRSLEKLFPILKDDARRASAVKAAREELEEQMRKDMEELSQNARGDWHIENIEDNAAE